MSFRSPHQLLQARSVAIVGASERAKWPVRIFSQLRDFGFPGRAYPINPHRSEVWGVRCYPSFAALPEVPDHALIIIPAEAVPAAVEEAAQAGVKAVTVYAANIGEGSDPATLARGARLTELCDRHGIMLAGPNCMGAISLHEKYFVYPDPELCKVSAGSVGAVFQSGGTLQFWCKAAAERGVKFSYAISSGNEIGLDLADYVNFLVESDNTNVIVLFIEGIRRAATFMAAASKALAAGKPIVAIKTGRSEKSRETARSHTGAIAGDYDVFAAMCERYGIIRSDSLDDMTELALALQGAKFPKGPRVGFVTSSGGMVDLLHDYLEETGSIVAPDFSPATETQIRPHVLPQVQIKNPLDAGIPSNDAAAASICQAVLADPNVDMLAWAADKKPREPALLRTVFDATEKPVIAFARMYSAAGLQGGAFENEVGVPFLQGLRPTLHALAGLAFFAARSGRRIDPLPSPNGQAETLKGAALEQALGRHGLKSPRSVIAQTPEEAAAAAMRIGFPVALKIVSAEISHKTEFGGVRLGLADAGAVKSATEALLATIRRQAPRASIDGVLVQEMVRGVEIILGARTDPIYGPVMVVGAGGIGVELTKDTVLRLLPVGLAEARVMIAELKVMKLLTGFRGQPAHDVEALVTAICGLSDFYLDHRHFLSDLEVNPLIVLPGCEGVRAVDIRLVPATTAGQSI
jgi:acetyltransferase